MATKKGNPNISTETLALYDALIAAVPEVERKGDAVPYTSHKGHMFSMLDSDGILSLRLPPDELDAFLKKFKTQHPLQYGVVRKDYALVPEKLLKNTKELKPYFVSSFKYIDSLKPKATTRPKKK